MTGRPRAAGYEDGGVPAVAPRARPPSGGRVGEPGSARRRRRRAG